MQTYNWVVVFPLITIVAFSVFAGIVTRGKRIPNQYFLTLGLLSISMISFFLGVSFAPGQPLQGDLADKILKQGPLAIAGMSFTTDTGGQPAYFDFMLTRHGGPALLRIPAKEVANPDKLKLGDVRPARVGNQWDFRF